jgi:uncharacterized phage protein (TIGR01671 family)
MKDIKFRMWSEESKSFFYDPDNVFDCLKFSQKSNTKDYYKDMTWQQFTGFYDKHGKEIYEGDIVKDEFYQEITAKVVYKLGCFWLDSNHLQEDVERELYDSIQDSMEVIGNIFKNPELLK